jgi:Protein of unknown function (DUF998)
MEPSLTRTAGVWLTTGAGRTATRWLLACGIASSILYAAMLTFVPMHWAEYSSAAQTVSELSAIDAPTRSLWVASGVVWTLLYVAFGSGVVLSARDSRALRAAGSIIMLCGVFGAFWPPMHQREVLAAGGRTLTDTLHIAWTIVNGILTLLVMGFGGAALGKRFRSYSIATMLTLVAAGAVASLDGARVDANLPTPWIGVWERINIGAWLLWIAALSVMLLRSRETARRR